MVDTQIVRMVIEAVGKSCEMLAKQRSRITGYALCTDDNLWTVYHVASALALNGSSPYWSRPVEWSIVARGAKPLFSRISDCLRATAQEAAQRGDLAKHVNSAFESLVVGLDQMRPAVSELSVAGSELLLLVSSTDPSRKLLKMELEASRRLNSPRLYSEWCAMIHA